MPKSSFLSKVITGYLEARPFFFTLIRPQEALLFQQFNQLLKAPILDFGCGDGFFAQVVFQPLKIDLGLDVPSSRILEAH